MRMRMREAARGAQMLEYPRRNLVRGSALVPISSALGSLAAPAAGCFSYPGGEAPPGFGIGLVRFGLPVDLLLRRAGVGDPFVYALCGLVGGTLGFLFRRRPERASV